MQWVMDEYHLSEIAIKNIREMAKTDAAYIIKSIKRLQMHRDVEKIVVVTHTVPDSSLIEHDISLAGRLKFNVMGNNLMQHALAVDTENKIHTWCFGHYHGKIDQYRNGIRYVNNCRGRGDSEYKQWVYNPLRIEIN